jgi:hypothetical protein
MYNEVKNGVPRNMWITVTNAYRTVAIPKYREYAEEIAGIANILNITAADYYALNCYYELCVMCTSIVARDKNNKLILARNFDFGYTEVLRKMHINVVYKRNNKELAKCGNIAGYVGVFTCLKPYAFAISMNARPLGNVQDFISRLVAGRILTTWLLRDTMLNTATYEDAMRMIEGAATVSGSYMIIAGLKENEGTVITRARDSIVSSKKLSTEQWFLAKCNSDDGNTTDIRTNWVHKAMAELGQSNTDLNTVLNNVLLQSPLLRPTTVATILMSPVNNYYKSIIPTTPTTDTPEFP